LSWLLIEATLDSFKPQATSTQFMRMTFFIPSWQERATAGVRNAVLALGLMGASVGLAFGVAGGLARRSVWAGALAGVFGLLLGAAGGAGAAFASVPLASQVHDRDPGNMSLEMASSLCARGIPWAAIGALGGLAFGIGLGGRARAGRGLLGGLLGAVAGALLYEVIGALALPDTKIIEPIAASWGMRVLAQMLAVIAAAIGIAALVPDRAMRRS
jgi:hypothetical protein